MFPTRRYTTYLLLAACSILLITYYREPLASSAGIRIGSQVPLISEPGTPPPKPVTAGSKTRFQWSSVPTVYPLTVPLTTLPSGTPHKLPQIQYAFPPEREDHAITRKERQAAVKATFERCWNAYRQHAWTHDELTPLTGRIRDGFAGWGASLVDNLDTLWLMGLKSEFEEAVAAAIDIDLAISTSEVINVFETNIRHLGGFLAAYDVSGEPRTLDKAIEFGEMLLKAFDTPNRLPKTRMNLREAFGGRMEADTLVLVAEIGSLTMEFTRLSQLTGDMRWYDAVARITRLFDAQQEKTRLPGMWPVSINAKTADLTNDTLFTLGAMSDSLYEYFPKTYALLGGLEPVYKKLYDGSMATAIKYNLWRPMTPDNADILISGQVKALTDASSARLDPQGQHLVCFTGGMFALAGKMWNEPAHVEIGRKLTDGCIWTYKAFPLGIMPEIFRMVPCESRLDCHWDEELWRQEVKMMHPESADIDTLITNFRLPKGFTDIQDRRYILRPEAIESVFIMYRITGEEKYREAAWDMFTAIRAATEGRLANAALADVTYTSDALLKGTPSGNAQYDSMESFWMAETLKYFYLIFSEPDLISLDEWVFNTEAHPFRRPTPA
ncbi:glycoside hydrolase family 47 protein [Baudoinia panamericana UAMH 10762]|uniref:alpha-1,2-Mannosidase n=1 Tax=Baudoinia panamericana (strain UAMH 10762) TaxID=717646 RepID=M2MYP3_BAUPA|nr:glycoside hydrolase family 47 protein [Baudoinia panamericana UAMH 10762]EMC96728.1 glycoside hydrolase family 47 protein [Baudoinia panamericana UAMH 10762]